MSEAHPLMPDHASASSWLQSLRVLRGYRRQLLAALGVLTVLYAIGCTALLLLGASSRVTSQSLRLDFNGASRGEYPNGARFSPLEITATPVLVEVYERNDLARFLSFAAFARSVFVLESNPALEELMSDYQARLADPRLSALDRERIRSELATKRDNLARNVYSIHFEQTSRLSSVPEIAVRKVLVDILATWARHATNEQRILDFDVPVLSPDVLTDTASPRGRELAAVESLRCKLLRVLDNIDRLGELPGAGLVRVPGSQLSLAEVRLRLEDLIRYEVEPLSLLAAALDPDAARRFLQTQLAYDSRRLADERDRAAAVRDALAVYVLQGGGEDEPVRGLRSGSPDSGTQAGEGLMPQVSESFLDRLVNLATTAADREFRQRLTAEFQQHSMAAAPLQQAVLYDQQLISAVDASLPQGDPTVVGARFAAVRDRAKPLVAAVNDLHQIVSRNLNPATYLYRTTSAAVTRVDGRYNPVTLVLLGLLMIAASCPLLALMALLHHRLGQEVRAERSVRQAA